MEPSVAALGMETVTAAVSLAATFTRPKLVAADWARPRPDNRYPAEQMQSKRAVLIYIILPKRKRTCAGIA
jgi:hypothetical protein